MITTYDAIAALSTRLFEAKQDGKIQGENDNLLNIFTTETARKDSINLHIIMQSRARLIITIQQDAKQIIPELGWAHDPYKARRPSYGVADPPLTATLKISAEITRWYLLQATKYIIDAWLDDTNPRHAWTGYANAVAAQEDKNGNN